LLRGERVTLDGRFVAARDAVLLPAPIRRIPILIAGEGPRMIELSARWAELWNTAWYRHPNERLTLRLASLGQALAAEGRSRDSLRVSVGMRVGVEGPEEIASTMSEFAELGADQLILSIEPPRTERSLERVGAALAVYRAGEGAPMATTGPAR
jgi:alkanesulfonate monooxygenase SsuD/methylene tetrahydromethanopterin reductase-like flavin-dependent oxidoreductase (luciferase family)